MRKLTFKTKLLYGIGGIGDSALYNMMGTFAIFFLTTVAGVEPAVAGTITAIGAVWDTICGACVGYISDNIDTRFGRRKPFLMASAVPLALFISLFFFDMNMSRELMHIYYGVVVIMFWTSFASFFVPFLAWGAELTENYDERTVLRGYVSFFNSVGTIIGLAMPNLLVEKMTESGFSLEMSWQTTGMLCGIISCTAILVSAIGIKDHGSGRDTHGSGKSGRIGFLRGIMDMLKNYGDILKLRSIRYILGASVVYLIGYTIFCSDRMYYFTYNIGLSGTMITAVLVSMMLMAMFFVSIISRVNRWIEKRTTYVTGMLISAACLVIYGFSGSDSTAGVFAITMLFSIGNSCYWQLIPAMMYDVCEVDRLMNGSERSGMVLSLQSLSEAMSGAVAMQMIGVILSLAGFDGEASVQSETALQWTGYSFYFIPALFMVVSAFLIYKYPITKQMHNDVMEALEKRDRGEPVDMERFKKLK